MTDTIEAAQQREAERAAHRITEAVSTLRAVVDGKIAFDALSKEIASETRPKEGVFRQ